MFLISQVYIELEQIVGDLEDEHQPLCYQARERLSAMCAAFGQLVHKALAVSELNMKLQVFDSMKLYYYRMEVASFCHPETRLKRQHESISVVHRFRY